MTLGTGIFLSAILISGIILFISTKDRWRWKKIMLWAICGPLAIAVLCSVLYLGHSHYSTRPKVQDSLWGIKLGTPRSDVVFLKGKPKESTPNSNNTRETLSYTENRDHYEIFISTTGNVEAILCIPESFYPASLQEIGLGDSYEKVIKKFGSPTKTSETPDGLSRLHHFARHKVFFAFRKGVVESFGIDANQSLNFAKEKPETPK